MSTAISVQNLGKKYITDHKKKAGFRHAIGDKLKGLFRPDASEKEEFFTFKLINNN